MYQVIARKYRPQTFRDVVNQEHVKTTLRKRHRAEPHRARLHLFRPARHRQNHHRAHSGALPELHSGTYRYALRRMRQLPGNHRRRHRGRHRNRRRLQSRHQRNARTARKRPLPAGARPLQGLHHRRSPPDHQRGLQRAAEDHRRAAASGWSSCSAPPKRTRFPPPSPRAASISVSARWISKT